MATGRHAPRAPQVLIGNRFADQCTRKYLIVHPLWHLYMKGIPSLCYVGLLLYCSHLHAAVVRPDDKGNSRGCDTRTSLTDTWVYWRGSTPNIDPAAYCWFTYPYTYGELVSYKSPFVMVKCYTCTMCVAGWIPYKDYCTVCYPGTYAPQDGASSCPQCPKGTNSVSQGT